MAKKSFEAHTNKTKRPFGDYYGTGARNPIGKVKEGTVGIIKASKKKLAKPPKTLA